MDQRPFLSVIVCTHNSRDCMQPLLARLHACPVERLEVVVVDDGSDDGTQALLEGDCAGLFHKAVYRQAHGGLLAAAASGAAMATGEYAIVQAAGLLYDPADYAALLATLQEDEADIAVATGQGQPGRVPVETRAFGGFSDAPVAVKRDLLDAVCEEESHNAEYRMAKVSLPRRPGAKPKNNKKGRRAKKRDRRNQKS